LTEGDRPKVSESGVTGLSTDTDGNDGRLLTDKGPETANSI